MSNDSDQFFPPSPEQVAHRNALAEIKEEIGKLKNKIQSEIRALKKKRRTENRPSEQASLDEQIVGKEQEFKNVDCVFYNTTGEAGRALQDHFKSRINWDEIMRKHGVSG